MNKAFNHLYEASRTRTGTAILGVSIAIAAVAVIASAAALADPTSSLQQRLQARFPKTRITAVDCKSVISDLCEVTAGSNLFYASRDGRYVVVGSLLDLEKKVDLTDERLRQLAAVDGAIRPIGATVTAPPSASTPSRVSVDLPLANAIVHHRGAPIKIKVFSDFSCGYCRAFFAQLAANPEIEITEFPIAVLGEESRLKAKLVLCAADRMAASDATYAGRIVPGAGNCTGVDKAIDDNTRFARNHGIVGTPTIVRADGAMNPGYLDPAALKTFAESKT